MPTPESGSLLLSLERRNSGVVRHFNFAVSIYFKQLEINALIQENMRLNVKLSFNKRTLVGYDFGRMNRAGMPNCAMSIAEASDRGL
jgi:hypothetical protein